MVVFKCPLLLPIHTYKTAVFVIPTMSRNSLIYMEEILVRYTTEHRYVVTEITIKICNGQNTNYKEKTIPCATQKIYINNTDIHIYEIYLQLHNY
jgi:hypothetical protein